MNQAQSAQRLYQGEFASVKFPKLFVAVQQRAELATALLPITAEQHPQVLHGRAGAGVVEVNKVRARPGGGRHIERRPQNIAGVAVTMQAQALNGSPASVFGGSRHLPLQDRVGRYHLERLLHGTRPGRLHVQRQPVVGQQPVARLGAKTVQIQGRPASKRPRCAHAVNPS